MIWSSLIIILIIILLDFLSFHALKHAFRIKQNTSLKKKFKYIFWSLSILIALFGMVYFVSLRFSSKPDYIVYRNYFKLAGIFFVFYIPKIFFIIFYVIELLIRFPAIILKQKKKENKILSFFSSFRILSITGAFIAVIFCLIVVHGIFIGRTNFKVEHVTLPFKDLPKSFDGVKIALISDMHLGSFGDSLDVKKGIDLMMNEKPDIIFFTGDLVNNESEEAGVMMCELTRMHAPFGMYSILGNHDVGDYRRWKTIEEKNANLDLLKALEERAGFKLLIDENFILKKNNDSIAIIGVNSWGLPPFKSYGDLNKAMNGVNDVPFKILLTHSPVHWDKEVSGKKDIQLSLSGHTHAMQFGINCCGIFWSPLKWMYPHWAGLYNEGEQYLYVNRGFGYIGYPGRIGMTPEITIIELKKK
ncbi:MAG: metallophosphoesterase [Bacteroidota bacterium]